MKKQIQELIIKWNLEVEKLKMKQNTAEALGFNTECSSLTEQMRHINLKIVDLHNLIK